MFTAEMLGDASRQRRASSTGWATTSSSSSSRRRSTTRIVNQYALFSLMSRPTASLDEWADAHDRASSGAWCPAELKWEVRDKLDQANITERVLFPGLDGLDARGCGATTSRAAASA